MQELVALVDSLTRSGLITRAASRELKLNTELVRLLVQQIDQVGTHLAPYEENPLYEIRKYLDVKIIFFCFNVIK